MYGAIMSPSGPWWASPLIALVGSITGVVLTLVTTGRRDARSRFGDDKRAIYVEFLLACVELRDATVWTPTSEPGAETAPLLKNVRAAAMHAALIAHRNVGRELANATAASETLAAMIDEIRRTSKPGYRGVMDERHRARYDEARSTLSARLNDFTKAARVDLNVRTPVHPPFPATSAAT